MMVCYHVYNKQITHHLAMSELIIRYFNAPIAYADTLDATNLGRNHEGNQADEIKLLEHLPVYTLGKR